jgi:tetratricopeptide (TPR) repeat protein
MSAMLPLCFVLMPFGKKTDSAGLTIDFDAVYNDVIQPAIRDAGLDPLRADEEMTGGIIHKPMFERLILCPFAVADLTTANANVFYELGVRHAVRGATTVLVAAEGGRLPFDVAPMRALGYRLTADGRPANPSAAREAIRSRLAEARRQVGQVEIAPIDSPLYQLIDGYPNVQHEKTDVFRDRVNYSRQQKEQLADARRDGLAAVQIVETTLGELLNVESGVLIDLFLSYRSVKGWQAMIDLAAKMPAPLKATVMVQEQLALALNRIGRDSEAEAVLQALLGSRGPSSETYGILGRVYKDRWEKALKRNDTFLARGLLDKAIDVYLKGFESDWRDAYPGVNAVTLMELREPPDVRQQELIPIVTYAVKRRMAAGRPDYWDYATLLELAVLARDQTGAYDALTHALPAVREKWEPETTLRNLNLILEARARRNEEAPAWALAVVSALDAASK